MTATSAPVFKGVHSRVLHAGIRSIAISADIIIVFVSLWTFPRTKSDVVADQLVCMRRLFLPAFTAACFASGNHPIMFIISVWMGFLLSADTAYPAAVRPDKIVVVVLLFAADRADTVIPSVVHIRFVSAISALFIAFVEQMFKIMRC